MLVYRRVNRRTKCAIYNGYVTNYQRVLVLLKSMGIYIYIYIHIYIHTYIHIYVCVGFMTDLMFFRGDYDKPYEWETVLNRLVYNSIYNEIGKRGYF